MVVFVGGHVQCMEGGLLRVNSLVMGLKVICILGGDRVGQARRNGSLSHMGGFRNKARGLSTTMFLHCLHNPLID